MNARLQLHRFLLNRRPPPYPSQSPSLSLVSSSYIVPLVSYIISSLSLQNDFSLTINFEIDCSEACVCLWMVSICVWIYDMFRIPSLYRYGDNHVTNLIDSIVFCVGLMNFFFNYLLVFEEMLTLHEYIIISSYYLLFCFIIEFLHKFLVGMWRNTSS